MAPRWVEKYLGIPFKERGLTREGCDCWGLVRLILLEQMDLHLPEHPEISEGATLAKLRTIVAAAASPTWHEVVRGSECVYDVVLMRGHVEHAEHKYQRPIHIGLVVVPGTLIHVEVGSNVSITDYRRDIRTKNRVHGFYRHAEL